MTSLKTGDFLSLIQRKMIQNIGPITFLFSLIALGAVGVFYPNSVSGFLCLMIFGIFGLIESLHFRASERLRKFPRQRWVAELREHIVLATKEHPGMKWKPDQQFKHEGVKMAIMAYGDSGLYDVAGPLCPDCGKFLAERAEIRFMIFPRFRFFCRCGFNTTCRVDQTTLQAEAAAMFNIKKSVVILDDAHEEITPAL